MFLAIPAMAQVRLPPHGDRSVHDLAGVISAEDARAMEAIHTGLFARTGVAIVVVTVPELEGEPIDDFAVRVGTEWGVGRKGEDRGIVVALAVSERRFFIATGYGVEGYLPDGKAGEILDRFAIPPARRGDYSGALLQTSAALVRLSADEHGVTVEELARVPAPPDRRRGIRGGGLIPLILLGAMIYLAIRHPSLFVLLMLSGRGGGRRRGGFGGGGFGGGTGFGGFGGGGFGGGGAGRGF